MGKVSPANQHGGHSLAQPRASLSQLVSAGGALGQGHVELQHRAVVLAVQADVDGIIIHLDVATDHLQQLALEHRHVVGLSALAALVRHDDLQPLLGDRRGLLALSLQEFKQFQRRPPPNMRLSRLFFWYSWKRSGTSSPSRRATVSVRSEEHTSELQSR